jgi:hypothetical protein
VLVAHQVKNAVDHEQDDHFHLLQAEPIRLTPGRVHGDDDIAQKLRVERDERSLPHGEGKNIGRFITVQIASVQLANLAVADQGDADFRIRGR